MDLSHQQIEEIEAYLVGELEEAALEAFEQQLKDEKFRSAVEWYEAMVEGVQAATYLEEQELETKSTLKRKKKLIERRILPYFISGLIGLIIGFLLAYLLIKRAQPPVVNEERIQASQIEFPRLYLTTLAWTEVKKEDGEVLSKITIDSITLMVSLNDLTQLQYRFDGNTLQLFTSVERDFEQVNFQLTTYKTNELEKTFLRIGEIIYNLPVLDTNIPDEEGIIPEDQRIRLFETNEDITNLGF